MKFVFVICLLTFSLPKYANETLPDYFSVKSNYKPSDILYFDRNENPFQSVRVRNDYRSEEWFDLEEISPLLINAVIFSEDQKFYEHSGVDSVAFLGSLWNWIFGRTLRGGSTISMQLVGILEPDLKLKKGKRSLPQKLKQIQKATSLEEIWTKKQILTAYFNLVFFRGELRGIGSAAKGLFNKKPLHLTENESYILAALIRSPEGNIEKVTQRSCLIQKQMNLDKTNDCEILAHLAKQALYKNSSYSSSPNFGKHFIKQFLSENNNTKNLSISKIHQSKFEKILKNQIAPLRKQMVDDGAILVLHNRTGEVIAYVANTGTESEVSELDLIQTKRQAGSTLKPFVYAQSFEESKLTPTSILNDAPIDIPVFRGIYRPLNYDKSFKGKVTVRESLGSSLNIPAVRTLSYLDMGMFLNTLANLGFKKLAYPEFYGPSLALGTADVSLWELTNAYRTLANGGEFSEPSVTLEEKLNSPNNSKKKSLRIFRESVSFLITNILSDREARSLSFGWENNLSTPFFTAVKTGTSQDMRDNWCVGYSSEYTVGVWVGNTKGIPMRDVSGVSGAGPIWREVMEELHYETPSKKPLPPQGVVYSKLKNSYYESGMELIEDEVNSFRNHNQSIPFKIESPTDSAIFAYDYDIPKSQQRILFRLNKYDQNLIWVLNGKRLENARDALLWNVEKGIFILELIDKNEKTIDKINFEVR